MIGAGYGFIGIKQVYLGLQNKFVLFPVRCHITKKILWLKTVIRETNMYTGPGDPIYEHFYYDKKAYVIAKLKGEV